MTIRGSIIVSLFALLFSRLGSGGRERVDRFRRLRRSTRRSAAQFPEKETNRFANAGPVERPPCLGFREAWPGLHRDRAGLPEGHITGDYARQGRSRSDYHWRRYNALADPGYGHTPVDPGGFLAAALKHTRSALRQSFLPNMDHRRMNPKTAGQARHRRFTLQYVQCYLRLELRANAVSGSTSPVSSSSKIGRQQIIACASVRISGRSSH